MCLVGLKSRCGLVCPLSGMSGGGSVPGPFPPSRGAPIPWPTALPSIFKAHHSNLCLRHRPAFSDPPASVSPGTCGYTGPTGWSRITPASHCCHGEQQAAIQERMPPEPVTLSASSCHHGKCQICRVGVQEGLSLGRTQRLPQLLPELGKRKSHSLFKASERVALVPLIPALEASAVFQECPLRMGMTCWVVGGGRCFQTGLHCSLTLYRVDFPQTPWQ